MDSNFQNRINFQNMENSGFRQDIRQYNDPNYKKSYKKNYNQSYHGGNKNYHRGSDEQNSDNMNYSYPER